MDDHIRIVDLELNHSALEALGFWKMLGKFTGKFIINIELEVVALGDDVHCVPIAFLDIFCSQSILDGYDSRFIILSDHQPVTTKAAMFLTSGSMEVPCAHHVFANAEVPELSLIHI